MLVDVDEHARKVPLQPLPDGEYGWIRRADTGLLGAPESHPRPSKRVLSAMVNPRDPAMAANPDGAPATSNSPGS
jgi:hypothetical protein